MVLMSDTTGTNNLKAEEYLNLLDYGEENESNFDVEVPAAQRTSASAIGTVNLFRTPSRKSLSSSEGSILSPPRLEKLGFLGFLSRKSSERNFQELSVELHVPTFDETANGEHENIPSNGEVLNIRDLFESPSKDSTQKTSTNSSAATDSDISVSIQDADSQNESVFQADPPDYNWFPMEVPLSLLNLRNGQVFSTPQSTGPLLIPSVQQMAQDSIVEHLKRHCHYNIEEEEALLDSKDTTSIVLGDCGQASRLIKCFLRSANYDGAIAIGRALLLKKKDCENTRLLLVRQLALLCLAADRQNEAVELSNVAVKSVPAFCGESVDATLATNVLLENGLVLLGCNHAGQAIQTLREALHICICERGYENRSVARLLNLIGVHYLHDADLDSALYCLQESVELQQSLLGVSIDLGDGSVDEEILVLAVTMCNLAIGFEKGGQCDRSLTIFDETLALLQSIQQDTLLMEDCVKAAAQQVAVEQKQKHLVDPWTLSLLRSSDTDWTSAASTARKVAEDLSRSLIVFGNKDGIPGRHINTKLLTLSPCDAIDILLLGPVECERSSAQMVRQVVLDWFGKRLDDDYMYVFDHELCNLVSVSAAPDPKDTSGVAIHRGPLPIDLDDGGILHADLYLGEIQRQAYKHLENQEFVDAVELFRSSLQSHRKKYGTKHHLIANTLFNMGIVHFVARQHHEALVLFDEAATMYMETMGEHHPGVQYSRLKSALIHFAIGETVRARHRLEDIRDSVLVNFGYKHPLLAKILNNLGVVSYELGDVETAVNCFEMTLEYYRQIAVDHCIEEGNAEKQIVDHNIACAMSNLAFVFYNEDEPEGALDCYEGALRNLRQHPSSAEQSEEVQKSIEYIVESTGIESEHLDSSDQYGESPRSLWDIQLLVQNFVNDCGARMDER